MAPLDQAVGLLDRALTYTQATLNDVTETDLGRRTPCEHWNLGQLLAHMEDALDAFAEGECGEVDLRDSVPARARVASLQRKACAMLRAWTTDTRATVRIGDRRLDTEVVVLAAALEVTVHGWDVSQGVGTARPIPLGLARGLLPVAQRLVAAAARGVEFDRPRWVPPDAAPDTRLLGFLGRDAHPGIGVAGPLVKISGNRDTGGTPAS